MRKGLAAASIMMAVFSSAIGCGTSGSMDAGGDDAAADVVRQDVQREATPAPEYFTPCTSAAMCQGTMAKCDALFPGGSCTIRCTSARACGEGATCVTEANQCYRTCTIGGGECGPTETCIGYNETTNVCFPACSETPAAGAPACNSGTTCNPYSNLCQPPGDPPMGSDNGGTCTTDDQCKSGRCIAEVDEEDGTPTGYLGGYCISFGRQAALAPNMPLPRSTCPAGSIAYPTRQAGQPGDSAVCLKACMTSADCRGGYECERMIFSGTAQPTNGFCSPINCLAAPYSTMANGGCPAGTACQRTMVAGSTTVTGTCARAAAVDAGPEAGPDATPPADVVTPPADVVTPPVDAAPADAAPADAAATDASVG